MERFFILLVGLLILGIHAQDTFYLKVHFLYGSRPLKKYKKSEPKWFGGIWGGHVGIESDTGEVLNFLPEGKFHKLANRKNKHSTYALHTSQSFYAILGGEPDSVKKAIVYIPVTLAQKQKFDSLSDAYRMETPYDYAFWGMRCGAAAYEILGQLKVVKQYSYRKTYRKIFYPRRLRKHLLKKARQKGWRVEFRQGSCRRKWEKD